MTATVAKKGERGSADDEGATSSAMVQVSTTPGRYRRQSAKSVESEVWVCAGRL